MEIKVYIRQVYGNETIYPACSKAKLFAKLVNTKTLTLHAIEVIKELGYVVQIVSEFESSL